MIQQKYLINKKKRLVILKKYFAELWIKFYIQNILSFDLILKFNNLNLVKLQKLLNTQEIRLKLNFMSKLNKEIVDSLYVIEQLTDQKNIIHEKLVTKDLYLINTIHKYNFYKFLNFFICYIYPTSLKLNLLTFNNTLLAFYNIKNFETLVHSEYDFFENVNLYLFFNFKLSWTNTIDKKYCMYYLSSLKLLL